MGLFERFRYAQAFESGQAEHASARMLGVALAITLWMEWRNLRYGFVDIHFMLIVCALLWIFYSLFHATEKALYPGNH